ncbi:nuclear RNA export factor 2-like isoform X2 [Aricia agestis]|nr:nuclear RNA export factor 2-like isoform X2 [Aricia agestis]
MHPSNSYPRKSLQINLLNRPNEVEKAVEKESGTVFNRLEPRQVVNTPTNAPLSVAVDGASSSQLYSPTEMCENEDDEFDVDSLHGKRQSAFDRLGPLTESKKPKLTINLNLTKEQRQVVQEEPYIPTCKRPELVNSMNDIVRRYLPIWPWNYTVTAKKSFTARVSKSVMLMEKEQVDEIYGREHSMIQVSIKGFPKTWTKEDILDVLLENLKGKSFIPCFIELTKEECKFLVNKCKGALLEIHGFGFFIRQYDIELALTISIVHLTATQLDFRPREIIQDLVKSSYKDGTLNLKSFTLQKDLSHFIYYPLNRIYNQREMIQQMNFVNWRHLTDLNLSHNRLTSLDGFHLPTYTPRLRSLDLSYNHIPSLPTLLTCRGLPLKKLWLEGNPLCLDVNADTYVECLRMMFSGLKELDGEPIHLKGEMPKFNKNYCPEDVYSIVEKYLETFYTLIDSEKKELVESMYDKNAVLTITARNKLRHDYDAFRYLRPLFQKCRVIEQKVFDSVRGPTNIKNLITAWPKIMHDPTTFTTDVMHYTTDTVVLKVAGVMKVVAASLAEDEHVLAFARTVVLHTRDSNEYKITNEMLYWDEPTREYADAAFKLIRIRNKKVELKFESTPDESVQEELIRAFMKVTRLEAAPSRRCLEEKDWHFKHALEYYVKLLKLDNTSSLYSE